MSKKRWLADWANSGTKPAIYHCVSRVVDRRFVFGDEEREAFRMFMRMYENFSGCRVLSYCVMSNHFHLLLEVPPTREDGISDELLLKRLGALYSEKFVAGVAGELAATRVAERFAGGTQSRVREIHERFNYRMESLSHFMQGLLIRFTRWFNRKHERTGTLWEERFKSVIVESGIAAKSMAAYIDLNPVRAGMVEDPADYRWSSYGEAVGGGRKGNGKKAREGLVRAYLCHRGAGFEAEKWRDVSRGYRRLLGMALARKASGSDSKISSTSDESTRMNDAEYLANGGRKSGLLPELTVARILCYRVRYFTDGAVIGSREFVNEAFAASRERFSKKRKDGARRMKGNGSAARDHLWSMRDLRVEV